MCLYPRLIKNPKALEKRICLARKPKQLWTDYKLCKRENCKLYHKIHHKKERHTKTKSLKMETF